MERNKNVSCLFHCTKLSSLCYVLYSFSERIVVLENAAIIVDLFTVTYIMISKGCTLCGLRGCKNRPALFLARCHTRQLNQALSVLSLNLVCLSASVVLLTRAPYLHCVICVFCLLVVLVRLSVPLQVIDWKDSSPK